MFNHARFRWAFAGLVGNPGMPFEWDPYGIPLKELLVRALTFEGEKFHALPSRRRALVIALAMLETDLIPHEGKETLFLTCREYARKHGEIDATDIQFERAEKYMKSIGLLSTENLTERMIAAGKRLGQAVFQESVAKKR